ncbi:hypothetical protein ARMGADRAFT_901106, partial [Armillaria gallica]
DGNARQIYGSPDTLISATDPFLHVANFSDTPVVIAKGWILGKVHNPRNWLDQGDEMERMRKENDVHMHLISTYVQQKESTVKGITQAIQSHIKGATESDDPASQPPVEGGPKTAEVPDDPIMAAKLLDKLDLSSSLTDNQRCLLQKVILENQHAFGLDNCLGNNDARVEVRLKTDAQPVSLPPFPASPANRAVM